MANFISKFILILSLTLASVSICIANDDACDNGTSYKMAKDSSEPKDARDQDHHCICSLTCHNLYISFLSSPVKPNPIIISLLKFNFIETAYPEVLLSLDKPPIV